MATRVIKFAEDKVTPLADRIFGTIEVLITPEMQAWIHENEARIVDEYVVRKIRESNGTNIVKCGRTVTKIDSEGDLCGYFHWSLKGDFYDQVVVWSDELKIWVYAKH